MKGVSPRPYPLEALEEADLVRLEADAAGVREELLDDRAVLEDRAVVGALQGDARADDGKWSQ